MKRYKIFINLMALSIFLFSISCSSNNMNQEISSQEFAGKVNKIKIKYEDYYKVVRNERETFFLEHNANPSPTESKILEDKAWNMITEGYFLKNLFQKEKIIVSQREMIDSLKTNIPDIIKRSPKFMNEEGNFDFSLYEKSLLTNKPIDLNWLKQYYFVSYIPMAKLKNKIISRRPISDKELKSFYFAKNTSCDAYIVDFPYSNYYDKIQLSQKDIDDYYQKNISSFENPAQCKLQWAIFPINADTEDSLYAKNIADSLYNELLGGASFPIMASKFSDGGYADKKGSAGFMELDYFSPEIKAILAKAELNKPLKPMYHNRSFFIFLIQERTEKMVKILVLQTNIKPTPKTINRIKDRIKQFRELSQEIGFGNAGYEYHINITIQDSVSINDFNLKNIGYSENVIRRCLMSTPGTVFEPIKNDNLEAFIVFYVDQNTPRTLKRLNEVNDQILEKLQTEKSRIYAIKDAENYIKNLSNKENVLSDNPQNPVKIINNYNWNSALNNNYDRIYNKMLLSNQYPNGFIYSLNDKVIVTYAKAFSPVSFDQFIYQKTQLSQELKNEDAQIFFQDYLDKERKKAKIKDFRK